MGFAAAPWDIRKRRRRNCSGRSPNGTPGEAGFLISSEMLQKCASLSAAVWHRAAGCCWVCTAEKISISIRNG
jgi:hypothetical protein